MTRAQRAQYLADKNPKSVTSDENASIHQDDYNSEDEKEGGDSQN